MARHESGTAHQRGWLNRVWKRTVAHLLRRRKAPATIAEEAEQFVGECEAFIAGRYAEWLSERGAPVSGWAWVNRLAHGSDTDMQLVAKETLDDRAALMAGMAGQLLDIADRTKVSLATLQQSVVVPLESCMRERFGDACPRDHAQLAEWLRIALGRVGPPWPGRPESGVDRST